MDVSEFKAELGSLLHDASNVEFTEADILRWLNRGQKYAAMKLGCQQRIFSASGVINQAEYTWPTSALKILSANYNWEDPLTPTSVKDLRFYDEDWLQANAVTNPTHYRLVEKSRKVAIYPPPSSAADTTAINDGTDITAADTTITADSTSGFSSRGRIIIDTEVIGYTGTTTTTITGCTRGLEDTTAAIHLDNAVITFRDIAFWCVEAPDALTATTDEPWDGLTYLEPFHGVLLPYCLYMAKMKDGEPQEAKEFYRQWLIELDDMRKELNKLMPERVYQYIPQEPKTWPPRLGYTLPIEEA